MRCKNCDHELYWNPFAPVEWLHLKPNTTWEPDAVCTADRCGCTRAEVWDVEKEAGRRIVSFLRDYRKNDWFDIAYEPHPMEDINRKPIAPEWSVLITFALKEQLGMLELTGIQALLNGLMIAYHAYQAHFDKRIKTYDPETKLITLEVPDVDDDIIPDSRKKKVLQGT